MNSLKTAFIGIGALLLVACGGGGSSSGGSATPPVATPPPPPSIDGTYTGSYTATFTVQGRPDLTPTTETISLTAVIDGREIVVTETGSDLFTAPGTLDENNGFNVTSGPGISFTTSGILCTGELTFAGAVVGTQINGGSRALFRCSQRGISVEIVSEGDFVLNKTSAKTAPSATIESVLNRLLSL